MSKHLEQGDTVAVSIAREVPGELPQLTCHRQHMHSFTSIPIHTATAEGECSQHLAIRILQATEYWFRRSFFGFSSSRKM